MLQAFTLLFIWSLVKGVLGYPCATMSALLTSFVSLISNGTNGSRVSMICSDLMRRPDCVVPEDLSMWKSNKFDEFNAHFSKTSCGSFANFIKHYQKGCGYPTAVVFKDYYLMTYAIDESNHPSWIVNNKHSNYKYVLYPFTLNMDKLVDDMPRERINADTISPYPYETTDASTSMHWNVVGNMETGHRPSN